MPLKAIQQALTVALIYVIVAAGWILFSDELLKSLVHDADNLIKLSILKGWVFVLVTGGCLYFCLHRLLGRWEREVEQRKEAEAASGAALEKLRQRAEQLRLVVAGSVDGMWDLDCKTGIAELSPRYWEIIGDQPGEAVPDMSFFKRLVHPDDWPGAQAAMTDHLADKTTQSFFEYRLLTKNGVVKWMWGRGKVTARAADGTPSRMAGTISDITERKLAEQSLRESARFLQSTLDALSSHVAILDEHGTIIKVNAAWNRFARENDLSRDGAGENYLHLCDTATGDSAAGAAVAAAGIRKIMAGRDEVFELEYPCHSPQEQRWFTLRVTRFAGAGPVRVVVAHENISARKQAEAALRDSETRYRQLFELESDALFLVDCKTHCLLEVNQSAQRLYGYSAEEFLQLKAEAISAEPEKTRTTVGMGSIFVPLRWHRKKDGTVFPVEITTNVIEHQGRRTELTAIRDITERQQAIDRLQETTAQLLEAQQIASLGSYVLDVPTGQWTSSAVLDELFGIVEAGYTKDVTGWLDIIHPEERAELRRYLNEEVLKNRTAFDRNYRIVRLNDQQERWVHGIGKLVLDDRGRVVKMVGVIQDITEHQQAELALVNERALLRTLVNHLPVAVYLKDAAGRKTLANPADLHNMGRMSEKDVLGKTDYDLFPPEQAAEYQADDQQVLQTGQPVINREEKLIRPDGSFGWLLTSKVPLFDHAGQVTGLAGIGLDITGRLRAEQAHAMLATAIEQAVESIVITDVNGTIRYVNPAFEKKSGYTRAEVLGQNPRIFKSGCQDAEFYRQLWATLKRGEVWRGHFANKCKDGTLFEEDAIISPVRDTTGAIVNYVAVKRDVTREAQLEAQLRQAQKLEAVGTLAGGIAHDFNNILGAIIAFTEMTKMDHKGDAELQDNLAEVLKASQRAATLVRQILSFSRQQQLERSCLQISSVVKEVLKLLRATLPTTIAIEQDIAADLPDVLADPTQMHQVMMNLCTNAAHAMRGTQGQLRVQLDALHLPPGEPLPDPALAAGDYVRLIVSDTGHGMKTEILERIFEPFFTTKGPGEGTGLGLSVVHGIVKEHGGVIAVESQPGRGTTFTIYLPAQPVSEKKENANRVEIPKGNGERVLFVDDEPALGRVAHKMLQQLGYQTFVFGDAETAWNALQQDPAAYDVLITDLTMPVMTGLALAQRVFQLRPDLPIVLASGTAGTLTLAEFSALGIREVLSKPLNYDQLALALHQMLPERACAK